MSYFGSTEGSLELIFSELGLSCPTVHMLTGAPKVRGRYYNSIAHKHQIQTQHFSNHGPGATSIKLLLSSIGPGLYPPAFSTDSEPYWAIAQRKKGSRTSDFLAQTKFLDPEKISANVLPEKNVNQLWQPIHMVLAIPHSFIHLTSWFFCLYTGYVLVQEGYYQLPRGFSFPIRKYVKTYNSIELT